MGVTRYSASRKRFDWFGFMAVLAAHLAVLAWLYQQRIVQVPRSVTAGTVMWWRRRPARALGAPPAPHDFRVGAGIVSIVVLLGFLMALMAASLLLVLAVQWALRSDVKVIQGGKT